MATGTPDFESKRYSVSQFYIFLKFDRGYIVLYNGTMPTKDPEKLKAKRQRYRDKYRDKLNARRKLWSKNNPDKEKERKRRYIQNNPEKIKEAKRRQYINTYPRRRDILLQRSKDWRNKNYRLFRKKTYVYVSKHKKKTQTKSKI